MDEILKEILKNEKPPSLPLNATSLTESLSLDSRLARLCLLLPKPEVIDQNDNDAHIIWLRDEHNTTQECINGIDVKIFHSNDETIDFITEIETSNVFLIIDKMLAESILPFLSDLLQIVFVYVLANEENNNDVLWTESQIRQVSNNKDELFRLIIEDIDLCTKDFLSTSIFDLAAEEESINQTKNASFIWYHLLIESLLSLTIKKQTAKRDLIAYCREQYSVRNIEQQKLISEFEKEYSPTNAIRWYTRDSFIYRLLNRALRTRNIDVIFKFHFFIIDLQNQLDQYYNEELAEEFRTVYRGQKISPLELENLQKSIGKYISIHTYLSTSVDKEVALMYANCRSAVLFEIDIDITTCIQNKRARPVYVQLYSYVSDEYEVLFAIGSTFVVNSVSEKDNRWHIKLKLASYDDPLFDYIQTTSISKLPSTVKFAGLLLEMGEYEKAERYIQMLLEHLQLSSDNVSVGYTYDLMGQVCHERGDYNCALIWFKRALDTFQPDNIYRATIHLHIGNAHYEKQENSMALGCYNEALKYQQKMDPVDQASLYQAFGDVYHQMENFDDAIVYLNKTLDIHRSILSNRLYYAATYASLAFIYEAKSDYNEALQLCKCALNVLSQKVPKNHPSFVFAYIRVGEMHFHCGDSALAMIYWQKALRISKIIGHEEDLNSNLNPVLYLVLCTNIAVLYGCNEDVTDALHYAKEALDVYTRFENMVPKAHPIIKTLYNNLGFTHYIIGDSISALNYYMIAFDLPGKTSTQLIILVNIAIVYLDRGDTKKALNYLHESLELSSKMNPLFVDYNTLALIYYQISQAFKRENNLDKAIFFAEEQLRLRLSAINSNFSEIAFSYLSIGDLCPDKMAMCLEKAADLVLKHDLPTASGCACHTLLGFYYQKQNDSSNALFHHQSVLKLQLTMTPPCYTELITVFSNIAIVYNDMEPKDVKNALFYFETSRNIYLQLLNMKEIPSKDKAKLWKAVGHTSEDLKQNSSLTIRIFSIYFSIGSIYYRKKDYEQSLNHFLKVEDILNESTVDKNLMNPLLLYSLIILKYQLIGNFDRAFYCCEKGLKQVSEDYNEYGWYYCLIADIYREKKDYAMSISKHKIALTFLHNSQSIDHDRLASTYSFAAFSYVRMENYESALIYAQQAIRHRLLCDPIDYRMLAVSYIVCASCVDLFKPWNYERTLNYLLTGIDVGKNHLNDFSLELTPYSRMGVLYLKKHEYDNALECFNKELEHPTTPSVSYTRMRILYRMTGELDKAYEYAKKEIASQFSATTIDFIEISDSYIAMGDIHHQLGEYKRALKCYKTAFYILEIFQSDKTHMNYSVIYSNIGLIYYEYGQLTDALNYCLRARDIDFLSGNNESTPINLYINLGLIECKLENYYVALDYFGRAFELIYNKEHNYHLAHKILYNHIGYVYFKLDKMQVAMKNYLKSLSMHSNCSKHPDLAQVYKNIGLIYEQDVQNYPLAVSFYKRALELVPSAKHPNYILYKSMIITLELKIKKKVERNVTSSKKCHLNRICQLL